MRHSKLFCLYNAKNELISYNPATGEYKSLKRNYRLLKIWDYCYEADIDTWFKSQKAPPFHVDFKEIPYYYTQKTYRWAKKFGVLNT